MRGDPEQINADCRAREQAQADRFREERESGRGEAEHDLDLAEGLRLLHAAQSRPWRVNIPDTPGGRKVGEDWTVANLGEADINGKYYHVWVTTDRIRCSDTSGAQADDDARLIVWLVNNAEVLLEMAGR